MPTIICPHCAAIVPPKAKVCPDCGSDEQTGWSQDAELHRLGIPLEKSLSDDDYHEFTGRELQQRPARKKNFNTAVALLLIAAFIYYYAC